MPVSALAYDFEVDGIYYEILGDNQVAVTFQGYDDLYEGPPEPIQSYTGNVTIPETVTYEGTTYSVTSIGDCAFYGCSGLTSIEIPNSVTSIGNGAFSYCSGLMSVTIGNSVTSIGGGAFSNCSGLTSVTIPNSVTSIDSGVFCGCIGLTSVTIGNSVTSIDYYTFLGCESLASVTIGSSVGYIDDSAFLGCYALDTINFNAINCADFFWPGEGDEGAPFDNLNISTINIGDGVQRIPAYFTMGCSGLTSVTIPNSVTSIGNSAFSYCSDLAIITVESGNTTFDSRNNCNAIIETASNTLIAGCKATVIPNSVTSIGESAFAGCSGLTSLTIPNSVTYIGEGAFENCSGLTSVTIPNSVTSIDWYAFSGCSELNDVFSFIVDPTTVSMGNYAFYQYQNNYAERTLHVPFGTSDAYRGWSQYFGSIVEMGPMVATSIELDKSTERMEPGEELQLRAELKPIEAIYNEVLWGSSNPAVATVSNNGLVTAVNAGTATITAMTTDGSNLSALCIVTVYTEMQGDVDGNGSINISDVTSLIDYLLSGDASAFILTNADCDGSGNVNISDVTTLIDYLLSGNWPVEPEPEPVITSYTVNGVTFNMVEVEGGTFQMGATPEQGENANDNEKPVHQVTLSGFNIGQTEVTQELWQAVMGTNPSKFNDNVNKPIETISWEDCQTFIAALNELTGQNFRLPTEAEWEFAARGGMKSQGYKYSGSDDLNEIAWYNYNAYAVGSSSPDYGTHAAATKAANELGLYDMTGNVWEWCQDWSGDYSAADQINPTGPETGTNRVIRGGGWTNYPKLLRVAARSGYKPGFIGNFIGFRLAL